ncbi:MAG: GxxExxY protein [bacterium]|nr:MAG: GxxExxY protein [bacterium]
MVTDKRLRKFNFEAFYGPKTQHEFESLSKKIIVELKATREIAEIHFAQLRSYLKATSFKVGLMLNFGKPTLKIKRVVN